MLNWLKVIFLGLFLVTFSASASYSAATRPSVTGKEYLAEQNVTITKSGDNVASNLQPVGVLDNVAVKFKNIMAKWGTIFYNVGVKIFWSLLSICLVWTSGQMAIKGAQFNDVIFMMVRKIFIAGVFFWAFKNFDALFYSGVFEGFTSLAGTVLDEAGKSAVLPSAVLDQGLKVMDLMFGAMSDGFFDSLSFNNLMIGCLGVFGLCVMAILAIRLLMCFVNACFIIYGGSLVLALSGAEFTRDSAMNYIKEVVAVSFKYLAIILVASLATEYLNDILEDLQHLKLKNDGSWVVFASLFVGCVIILVMSAEFPDLISHMIGGISGREPSGAFFAQSAMAAKVGLGSTAVAGGALAGAALGGIKGAWKGTGVSGKLKGAAMGAAGGAVRAGKAVLGVGGSKSDSDLTRKVAGGK